ncbi:gamma-tubulin complex component 3 homolog [Rhizophagus clarus]|uniref:Gamma-tubulin complex component 3 homolog n=1 Tax=Rhizophagus clarus TaxID=94130 RepID=A0A8H3R4Q3_9GLOM|nr:gamma-tubulin complex component 3 homolog [Rhizophagus clarus]
MTSFYGNLSSASSKNLIPQAADVESGRISRTLTRLVKTILRESSNTANKANCKGTPISEIGKNAELSSRQQQIFEYCMRILGSRMTPSVVSDELHVSDLIKKKLAREHKSSANALRFANLFSKLQSQTTITRKWSILYFLLSLSDQSNINEGKITNTSPIEQAFSYRGLQNLSNFRNIETNKQSYEEEVNRFIPNVSSSSKVSNIKVSKEDELPSRTILIKQLAEFDHSNVEVSEEMLLRDIIFIFQGINGQFIKYNEESLSYIIDPKLDINRSTRDLLHRLTELGWLYKRVNEFVSLNVNDPSIGLVCQAFCSALQRELTEYYKFIAILEAQVTKQVKGQQVPSQLTLKRLLVWTQESLLKLRIMSVLVECCKKQRGGALVSTIYNYTNHGDPFIQQFINNTLEEVSRPFFEMLQRWIYEGELEDPFEEFFVACDPNVLEENLWQLKYEYRQNMQPTFISTLLAKKIFSIGKSLNFIRYSCHDNDWVVTNGKAKGADKMLKYGDIIALESSIDATYTATSQRLLNILFTKYKLEKHLTALKQYLLLGKGDFIQHLMVQLGPGLSKPSNTLYRHNLTGTLEAAIRASNAQYDDPDILRRLDVRLLEVSSGDLGWDVFSLDYHVDSPINTIFTPQEMQRYLKLFNFLWRLKRVEHDLSSAWRRNTTSARSLYQIKEIKKEINASRLVCSEMIHFVYQLQYYILFEVIECSWDELVTEIEIGTSNNQNYLSRLLKIIGHILQYKNVLDELHNFALKEISIDSYTHKTERIWGYSNLNKYSNQNVRENFKPIKERLEEVAGLFKGEVC